MKFLALLLVRNLEACVPSLKPLQYAGAANYSLVKIVALILGCWGSIFSGVFSSILADRKPADRAPLTITITWKGQQPHKR